MDNDWLTVFLTSIIHSHIGHGHISFLFINLPWLLFVLIASFIIDFLLVWLKTATFIYMIWTIKPALLTSLIRLWFDTALKRARNFCFADRDLSKIKETVLDNCLVYDMSHTLPLSFGRGYSFLLKWNAFIFNGICCWVNDFYLNLFWRVSDKSVVVEYLYILLYSSVFKSGKDCSQPSNNQMSHLHILIFLMMGCNYIFMFFQ